MASQHILLASAQLGFSSRRSRSLPGIRRILSHGSYLAGSPVCRHRSAGLRFTKANLITHRGIVGRPRTSGASEAVLSWRISSTWKPKEQRMLITWWPLLGSPGGPHHHSWLNCSMSTEQVVCLRRSCLRKLGPIT